MNMLARAIGMVILITASAAAPAAAGTAQPQLATSSQGSQVRCRYQETAGGRFGWTQAELRKIVVTPPTMYGLTRGQTVGWRFAVERSIDRGPWKLTYRSPIQKATAGPSRAASFTRMGVAVALPKPPASGDWDLWDVHYRVAVKMFWYRSDGTVQKTSSHLFDRYNVYVDGVLEDSWAESCQAEIRQFFDGPGG